MSWNDQNNNGSRDPWGNKNDAPDIDEAIKRFKAIFGPIFGGGSGGGGLQSLGVPPRHPYPTAAVSIDLDLFSRVSAVPVGGTAVGPGWDPSVPARLGGRVFWLVVRPAAR